MGRYLFLIGWIAGLCVLSAGNVEAQNDGGGAPDQLDVVIDRLRSDIKELREENRRLRERIEKLEKGSNRAGSSSSDKEMSRTIRDLRQKLRRYRNAAVNLLEIMEDTDTDLLQTQTREATEQESKNVQDTEVAQETGQKTKPDLHGEWIMDNDRPYPIRREPLDQEVTYTTGPNDTLSKIAHQYYHDSELWMRLYLVNENRLNSPDNLPPGTILRLPPINRIKQD